MKLILTTGILGAVLLAGATLPHTAHADEMMDNQNVQTRQHLMDGIGGAVGALSCYMKDQCELPEAVIRNLANGIAFSASAAPTAFEPQTSDASVKTTAKDDVWSKWDDFSGRFVKLEKDALVLAEAAGDKSATGAALGELGKSCKGCHDTYRNK